MLLFIKLNFKLVKVKPSIELNNIFEKLHLSSEVERIYTKIIIMNENLEEVLKFDGIIDTGAIISTLPVNVLYFFRNIKTYYHDIHGIVDKEECRVSSKIGIIPIKLIDDIKVLSPILRIPCAFTSNTKIPILIGMKNLLSKYSFSYNLQNENFSIEF